ncbi:hypothetical protein Sru01_24950 [Sphaerisporangium rufum]|uniref:Uncharacterized protein n=1 Tax=Sphaerisporangium rufum TaxID=1381558 RepID=A0A919R1V9_9ACTN|nr:hypothetical protein Sru01_24950 [Sphaerisporangium rufum]
MRSGYTDAVDNAILAFGTRMTSVTTASLSRVASWWRGAAPPTAEFRRRVPRRRAPSALV